MSGTPSSSGVTAPNADDYRRTSSSSVAVLDVLLGLAAVVFVGLMLRYPDYQAIPYHLLYVSIIIVYGFRVWPLRPTVVVIALIFIGTGAVEIWHFIDHTHPSVHAGHLVPASSDAVSDGIGELFEVVLMPAILVATVWSVRRRDAAERRMHEIAVRESDVRQAETQFLREAAHALRNPVAVARGWLDLADGRGSSDDAETRDRVRGELARVDRIALELLDVAAHPDSTADRTAPSNLALVASDALERWRSTAQRTWVLDADGSAVSDVDADRVADALDAIIDNALRFTASGDVVRVICRASSAGIVLAVADNGPGIPAADRARIFERFWRGQAPDGSRSTGLGLAMVAVVAEQFGGHAFARPSPEGGALVGIVLPQHVSAPHESAAAGSTDTTTDVVDVSDHLSQVVDDGAPSRVL
jgi:signal transduction histidine kinase